MGGTSPTGGTTTGRRDTGESTTLGTFYPHLSRLTAPLWLGGNGRERKANKVRPEVTESDDETRSRLRAGQDDSPLDP